MEIAELGGTVAFMSFVVEKFSELVIGPFEKVIDSWEDKIGPKGVAAVKQWIVLGIAVGGCFLFGVDLSAKFGMNVSHWAIGTIATGLIFAAGGDVIHKFFGIVQAKRVALENGA